MRRLLCLLITVPFLFSALIMPVSADYDRGSLVNHAEDLPLNEKTTCYIYDTWADDGQDYRVELQSAGAMAIKFESRTYRTYFYVCDENGRTVRPADIETTAGRRASGGIHSLSDAGFQWNERVERSAGVIVYENLDRGYYYIRIYSNSDDDDYADTEDYEDYGALTLTVSKITEASETNETTAARSETSGNGANISLYIPLKVGKTVQLGAYAGNTIQGSVDWNSSNDRIATVSRKGVVKGIRKGSATISVSYGKKRKSIRVIVTE